MSTADNLKDAFAGESQANRRYLAFAKKADDEKLPQIALLFRAAAEAETVHAHAHLRVMGGIKSTAENLSAAIEGEGFEFLKMYPGYLEEARAESNAGAVQSFENALAVERIHYDLYSDALETLKSGKDRPPTAFFVCQVCGNTVEDSPPDKCPICSSPKSKFKQIK